MEELTRIRWRTLAWVPVPLTVIGIIPVWLSRLTREPDGWSWGIWQWVGVWMVVNGLGLALWCVHLLNVRGRGTPVPFDPPKQFVAQGPYQYVRNPMLLGMVVIVMGLAVLFTSWTVALYAIVLMGCAHRIIRFWEEPQLGRRFGSSYRQYQQQVPRWIPRQICRAQSPKTR